MPRLSSGGAARERGREQTDYLTFPHVTARPGWRTDVSG
jgi:hypothetical protein